MTRPLLANRSPQTLALSGFVVFGIPKLRGLSSSGDSAESPRPWHDSLLDPVFERVQMIPVEPENRRSKTRPSDRRARHLNAFKWHPAPALQPSPPRSETLARYLNAFKRPATHRKNSRCASGHPAGPLAFERVQMTRRRSRVATWHFRRRPILLIPIPTGDTPMPPPQ